MSNRSREERVTNGPEVPFDEVNAEGDTKVSAQTAASDAASVAKEKTAEALGEAKARARETGRTLQNQALTSLDRGRRELARRAGGFAQALRKGQGSLDGQKLSGVSRYADQAAGAVEEVAHYLEERDFQALLRDLDRAVKRDPLLVYGGLFAVGALTVRALKGSGDPSLCQDKTAADENRNREANHDQ